MYTRWYIDEEDQIEIQRRVDKHISNRYPGPILCKERLFWDCVDVSERDYYYWLGWVVHFGSRVIYLELKWGSRGFSFERIGTEIQERWTMDHVSDLSEVKISTKRGEKNIELILEHQGDERSLMICPIRFYDQIDTQEIYGYQKRRGDHFKDAESRLKRMLCKT